MTVGIRAKLFLPFLLRKGMGREIAGLDPAPFCLPRLPFSQGNGKIEWERSPKLERKLPFLSFKDKGGRGGRQRRR